MTNYAMLAFLSWLLGTAALLIIPMLIMLHFVYHSEILRMFVRYLHGVYVRSQYITY